MAKLVQIIGVGHSPLLPKRFARSGEDPGIYQIKERYEEMGRRLLAAGTDLLLFIAHDHVNQWFMNNMPAFLVGKAPQARGPLPQEERYFGLAPYCARVDVPAAKAVLEGGLRRGIDFAYSDEFLIDHGFTMPLTYMLPAAELPIVPIFTNVMAPPIPPNTRFLQVGEILRSIIQENLPPALRVSVLVSGHLSVELGGPILMDKAVDAEFDRRVLHLLRSGDVEGLLAETSYQKMVQAGNFSSGVLDYVLALGMAGGKSATQAEGVFTTINTHAFLLWDLEEGSPA